MRKSPQSQRGRDRAREARLTAARERRLQMDPDQLARDRRIDDAVVDLEEAWERRATAEASIAAAEAAGAAAIAQLVAEQIAVSDIARLTGLDLATVRRLRRIDHQIA